MLVVSRRRRLTAAQLESLQRAVGNRAVTQLLTTFAGNGSAASVRLHGETKGRYDGGTSQVLSRKVSKAKGCDCPDEDPCRRSAGTLVITYKVDVDISMPGVPDGLTPCQQRRVRDFLRKVLRPQEAEHARRLRTYNGVTRRTFDVTGCGLSGLREELQARMQQMHDDEAAARAEAAERHSNAIDPFERDIDLDCE